MLWENLYKESILNEIYMGEESYTKHFWFRSGIEQIPLREIIVGVFNTSNNILPFIINNFIFFRPL